MSTTIDTPAATHTEPMPRVHRLADGVLLVGEYDGAATTEPVYLIRRSDGAMLRVSRLLYMVASAVDGERDDGEIAARLTDSIGRRLTGDGVAFLIESKLAPLGVTADGPAPKRARFDQVLGLRVHFPVIPHALVRMVAFVLQPLFFPPVIAVVLAGLVAADVMIATRGDAAALVSNTVARPNAVGIAMLVVLGSSLFHELGHATATRFGGARPGAIGAGVYIVVPVLYTDVSDSYRLSRRGRLRVDLGGVYFNAIAVIVMGVAWTQTHATFLILAMVLQQLLMIEQLDPIVRLDGYYVVADLIGVPEPLAYVAPVLRRVLRPRGEMPAPLARLRPWARRVLTAWSLLALALIPLLMAALIAATPALVSMGHNAITATATGVAAAAHAGQWLSVAARAGNCLLDLVPLMGVAYIYLSLSWRLGTFVLSRLRRGRTSRGTSGAPEGASPFSAAGVAPAVAGVSDNATQPHSPTRSDPKEQS